MADMMEKLDKMCDKMDKMDKMDKTFDEMNNQFDRLESQFDRLESILLEALKALRLPAPTQPGERYILVTRSHHSIIDQMLSRRKRPRAGRAYWSFVEGKSHV